MENRKFQELVLSNLATAYYALSEYSQALEYQRHSFAIAQELEDATGMGSSLGHIGLIQVKLEQYREALNCLEVALEILQETGNCYDEAMTLKGLADLYTELGQLAPALEYCSQALAIAIELEIPLAEECQELMVELKNKD